MSATLTAACDVCGWKPSAVLVTATRRRIADEGYVTGGTAPGKA